MLLSKNKLTYSDQVYTLTYSSIDKASLQVQNYLTSINTEKNTLLRARLTIEEILLRCISRFPEDSQFRIEMGKRWNRPFIVLKLYGEEYNPLDETEEMPDSWRSEFLSPIGLVPVFKYTDNCNIIQFPLKKSGKNPGRTLLISTLIGLLVGTTLDFFSPDLEFVITDLILSPLQEAFIRILNAVSAPVMFLSVLTTVYNVEGTAITRQIGKKLIRRFLIFSTIFSVLVTLFSLPFFNAPSGNIAITKSELSDVLKFFFSVIPGDVLSPFIAGDFTQLIIVALVLGNALLIAGANARTLVTFVDESYSVGIVVAEWIGDLSPGFVTILIILGIRKNTAHLLFGLWKPVALTAVFAVITLWIRMRTVSRRFRVPMKNLWRKMKESFLISLTTFSVETSYSANQRCCVKKLGISSRLTNYSLPIGLICFMPITTIASIILTLYVAECCSVPVSTVWLIIAVFLAVTLGAAGPPTAGIGILTYTVMFSNLNIPREALTLVLAGDILVSFVNYPFNQALLQLELIFEANHSGHLDPKVLLSEEMVAAK